MTDPGRPAADEYAEYYGRYIGRVPDGPVLATLERQIGRTLELLRAVPEARGGHRYAPGKWSVKEVAGHITDMERIFAGRALHFARQEIQPLPGVDFVESFDNTLTSTFYNMRKTTIYGGSSEVQKNIIAQLMGI